MTIKEIEINKLNPAPYNPRTITKEEFEGLKQSLKTFGLVDPIVVNKDLSIIGGHQRVRAWQELGNETAPCVVLDLDKKQEKKLNIVLNSQHISGKYDQLKLDELLEELKLDDDYNELRLNKLEALDLSEFDPENNSGDERLDKAKLHKCPDCGNEFTD
jgi:ParB-like chromosome segregation protein Spo0J